MNIFWANVTTLLNIWGMSHKDLGKKIGLSEASLSQHINGKCVTKLPTMQKVAKEIKIPLQDLLEENTEQVIQKYVINKRTNQKARDVETELMNLIKDMTDEDIRKVSDFIRYFKK